MEGHRSSAPREVSDVGALKALAHPLRQRIQEALRRGPASSTTLARALGESTGATSYHLRQLARYGFIEEAPERSRGRERWWRLIRQDLRFPERSRQAPAVRAALDQLNQLWSAEDLEALERFLAARDQMGAWGDALLYSRGTVQVTLEEARGFFEEYIALLKRYQREEGATPPGARTLRTRFLAFPTDLPMPPDQDGDQHDQGRHDTSRPEEPEASAD